MLNNLQNQSSHDRLGIDTLFSNPMINDRAEINKCVLLHSMKYMFDTDLIS